MSGLRPRIASDRSEEAARRTAFCSQPVNQSSTWEFRMNKSPCSLHGSVRKQLRAWHVFSGQPSFARAIACGTLLCLASAGSSYALDRSSPEGCAHLSKAGVVGACDSTASASVGGAPAKNPIARPLPSDFPHGVTPSGAPLAQDGSLTSTETYPVRGQKPTAVCSRAVSKCKGNAACELRAWELSC